MIPFEHFFYVSAILFVTGMAMILTRKNIVLVLVGVELMLNAANLNFVAFNRLHSERMDGQIMTIFVMIVAAAEAAIALALLWQIYRHFQTADLNKVNSIKEEEA
ncbi:MAG: NADH-quinone oxidoreductase subunit NuoK [Cytophagaceae bacterium]|jgi:NADH-quinone oxidoreductase subunit K|nr:NADH-quinone oxidoreductase subunit NuoK [Cytophagaceae bacterium]